MISKDEKIRTLIVDDETPARERISDLLLEYKEFEVIGECSNGEDAIKSIKELSPDLVFLDIGLQDLNGFEVLEKLDQNNLPLIVFITAYDEYALKAFQVHALDYLLKPFDDERFEEMIKFTSERIKSNKIEQLSGKLAGLLSDYKEREKDPEKSDEQFQNRLVLKSAGKVAFIETQNINWITADGYYASINVGEKTHLMRESLKNLEKILDPKTFLRIHRSTIININRIKEMHSHFHGNYFVLLEDGKRFKISRSYKEKTEHLLSGKF